MPNWVEQDLHVVGAKAEIDRFVKAGFRRRNKEQFDDLLDLHALCPLTRRERKDVYMHDVGVVLAHYRTRTQAFFSMLTRWDYPAEFYARLPAHWPTLSFASSVNEEMGTFGGVVVVIDGEVTNVIEDYSEDGYNRRAHGRRVRKALERWRPVIEADRDWRLVADAPWEHRSIPFDAHFDDDFWFYFRSREEMSAFRARYGGRMPLRRVDGAWKLTRLAKV